MVLAPKARKLRGRQIVPDNRQFYTIEQNGRVFYDSRTDVPCDMVEWERLHQKSKAQWERDKAEYAQLYGGKGIRTGHERPEFDE